MKYIRRNQAIQRMAEKMKSFTLDYRPVRQNGEKSKKDWLLGFGEVQKKPPKRTMLWNIEQTRYEWVPIEPVERS